jgi:hypothetical protein
VFVIKILEPTLLSSMKTPTRDDTVRYASLVDALAAVVVDPATIETGRDR